MLLFGLIVFLFEDVVFLHVLFAHGFFGIEDKLIFDIFLILKDYSNYGIEYVFRWWVVSGYQSWLFQGDAQLISCLMTNLLYTLIY